jgi:hypothetical protein
MDTQVFHTRGSVSVRRGLIEVLRKKPSNKGVTMAAMKPRTGDGPMEAEREARGLIVLKIPAEGGGRLAISVNDEEVELLKKVLAGIKKR